MPETVPELVLLSGRKKSIVGIGSPVALQKNAVDEPRFRVTVDPDEGEVKLMEDATVGMCVQRSVTKNSFSERIRPECKRELTLNDESG